MHISFRTNDDDGDTQKTQKNGFSLACSTLKNHQIRWLIFGMKIIIIIKTTKSKKNPVSGYYPSLKLELLVQLVQCNNAWKLCNLSSLIEFFPIQLESH